MGMLIVGLLGIALGLALGAVLRSQPPRTAQSATGMAPTAPPQAPSTPAPKRELALATDLATKINGAPWWLSDAPQVVAAYENVFAINRELPIVIELGWELDPLEFQRLSVEKRLHGHEEIFDRKPLQALTGGRPGTGTAITWKRAAK